MSLAVGAYHFTHLIYYAYFDEFTEKTILTKRILLVNMKRNPLQGFLFILEEWTISRSILL
jgi:hypothetical protein